MRYVQFLSARDARAIVRTALELGVTRFELERAGITDRSLEGAPPDSAVHALYCGIPNMTFPAARWIVAAGIEASRGG